MADRYYQAPLSNGLTLLGEQMPAMQSAAMTLLVPAGAIYDQRDASGAATVLSDLVLRGAGGRDSRQLTEHLDTLGLQRSCSVGTYHTRLGCAAVARNVLDSLPTYADIIMRPHLPETGFEAARDLALQSLEGVEDEPRQKVMIHLRQRHFPWPFGRNTMGEKDELEKLSLAVTRRHHSANWRPQGAILSLAGNIDFAEVRELAERCFGTWPCMPAPEVQSVPSPLGVLHVNHPSEQTHIGLAWSSIEETDPDYYVMRLAIEVLGGGMSGRLFTEVREKRGLVYNVWAGYAAIKGLGAIMGYAGTSNDRAQATLDAFIGEVHRLAAGVTLEELNRAKTGLKAATIMQGESTRARAGSIAHDYFIRGRIRTLDEVKAAIDSVTPDQVNAWLKKNDPDRFTVVTVGPNELRFGGLEV